MSPVRIFIKRCWEPSNTYKGHNKIKAEKSPLCSFETSHKRRLHDHIKAIHDKVEASGFINRYGDRVTFETSTFLALEVTNLQWGHFSYLILSWTDFLCVRRSDGVTNANSEKIDLKLFVTILEWLYNPEVGHLFNLAL